MKKILLFSALLLIFQLNAMATHNRAGEITYRQISQFTYEITLITYTYTPSAANEQRDQLEMSWGDGTPNSNVTRIEIIYLPDDIQRNTYKGTHTFPGTGIFQIVMSDPNRNAGIQNIPNSENIVFTVKTTIRIDPTLGFNNTPILLNPPIDKAAVGVLFIHNPNAYDSDGDSISYKMATCLGENGLPIQGYIIPSASNSISVNEITGDLVWDTPKFVGEYNIAMEIEEWRHGIKIGSIIRDMQIQVEETDNKPPVIENINDICILAGEIVTFPVKATDPDNDLITLTATGGPFQMTSNPAVFPLVNPANPVTSIFTWHTDCSHVQKQPHSVLFRAQDDNPDVQLTDYEEVKITVIAPKIQNLIATPTNNTVQLNWTPTICSNAIGYKIYRRISGFNFTPTTCETGVPSYTGYSLISEVSGVNKSSFTDDNNSLGLTQGYEYCYRIISYFDDDSESYTSDEVCIELKRDTPIFTKCSVTKTNETTGSIELNWLKPTVIDINIYPGPYKYTISSSDFLTGNSFGSPIDIFGIDNTNYTVNNINTKATTKFFKLELFSQNGSSWDLIGSPAFASTIFLKATPGDRKMTIQFEKNVPWTNTEYTIYRKNADVNCSENSLSYDSIGTTTLNNFIDYNLINDNNYQYLVKSKGEYDLTFLPKNLINYSQEICISPSDTIPPCSLTTIVESICSDFKNKISWQTNPDCENDAAKYLIYYSDNNSGELQLISTIEDKMYRYFIHSPENTLAGCYAVAAQDSAGNSIAANKLLKICVDNCPYYSLPNVFTPNGDGINDIFKPFPYKFVEKIDLKIYNRWGNLVFETNIPDINWNGMDLNKKLVSDGVYYYICDVYEKRLSGTVPRNISGFVHIFGNTSTGKE